MTISRFLFFIYIIFLSYSSSAIELKLPKVALSEVPFELEISEIENNLPIEISFEAKHQLRFLIKTVRLRLKFNLTHRAIKKLLLGNLITI